MYEYLCETCGLQAQSQLFNRIGENLAETQCPDCGGRLLRAAGMPAIVNSSMDTHFNHSVGRVIHTDAQFRSELSRASDEQSARLGMDHKFVPHDPRDKEVAGVTDEGLHETAKARRDSGLDSATKTIIV